MKNVAESHGIVAPLLPSYYNNANIHNFRAAFIAGLAQGMRKPLLLLQNGEEPLFHWTIVTLSEASNSLIR